MGTDNQAQIDLWDGRVGDKWAAMQVALDAMLAPATELLVTTAAVTPGMRVLDIGCGAGETCLHWLMAGTDVTGVDVSTPMLEVARARCGPAAKLIKADAAGWRGDTAFDLAVSRFGVMFFAEPYAAFANIAANVAPGGRLLFMCWRPVSENQWVSLPMGAVGDLLPASTAPANPHAPGPFAFADAARVTDILDQAGFAGVRITPFDFPVSLASDGGLDAAVGFLTQIGPTASALVEVTPEVKEVAIERLRTALAVHEQNGRVTLGGAIWIVEAIKP